MSADEVAIKAACIEAAGRLAAAGPSGSRDAADDAERVALIAWRMWQAWDRLERRDPAQAEGVKAEGTQANGTQAEAGQPDGDGPPPARRTAGPVLVAQFPGRRPAARGATAPAKPAPLLLRT